MDNAILVAQEQMQPDPAKTKGDYGEQLLNDWFIEENIPHLWINQTKESTPNLFPDGTKRPDFLILLQSIGMMAVDSKYKLSCDLTVDYAEIGKAMMFERLFRMPFWFVFPNGQREWFWISGLKVVEVGELLQNSGDQSLFYKVHPRHFVRISTHFDLAGLFTHTLESLVALRKTEGLVADAVRQAAGPARQG